MIDKRRGTFHKARRESKLQLKQQPLIKKTVSTNDLAYSKTISKTSSWSSQSRINNKSQRRLDLKKNNKTLMSFLK